MGKLKEWIVNVLLNIAAYLITSKPCELKNQISFQEDIEKCMDILFNISKYENFTDTYSNMYIPEIDKNIELIFRYTKKDISRII